VEGRTRRDERARLLARLSEGASDDEAFRDVLGLDTDGLDAALRDWILSEFPAPSGMSASRSEP
jgi:hypothetical protein